MNKKKTVKNIKTPNKFNIGGNTQANPIELGKPYGLNTPPTVKPGELIQTWDPNFKPQTSISEFFKGVDFKNAAGLLGGVAGGLISSGFSTTGGQVLSGIGDAAMMFNPLIGGAIKAASGLINRGFGTKWDNEGLAKAEAGIDSLKSFSSGATDYDALMGDFNKMNKLNTTIKASDLGEDGWFVNRTTDRAKELNTDMSNAYNFASRNINNVADNIANSTLANLERNYAAFGGPLFAYGGQTHGADFTNGLMFINNGGTHESNPYEGVPISMDQEGNPNLVEEGEVVWNDYVFSNRLKVPKAVRTKYKLRGPKDMTFAEAIEKLSKESEERPNDPISIRGLDNSLLKLAMEQEQLKVNKPKNPNKFDGGGAFNKYGYVTGYNGGWFDANGQYTEDYRNRVNNMTLDQLQAFMDSQYAFYSDSANANSDRWKAIDNFYKANSAYNKAGYVVTDTDLARAKRLALDGKPGYMHYVVNEATTPITPPVEPLPTTPATANVNRYFVRTPDGNGGYTHKEIAAPYQGVDATTLQTWEEANPYLVAVNGGKGTVREATTVDGVPTIYTDYYYTDNTPEDKPKEETTPTQYEKLPTWMRFAPIIGHGALALTDAFGLTNKPDYTNAEAIINAANKVSNSNIKFNPIGDYLTYNPFDTEYHANQLRSVAGATRRQIMNTSGGNRAAAMAGVLASDNNTMNQMGDLYRKAAEYNLEQRHKVADFNRDTNKFNSEGIFRADAANQAARQAGLQALISGYTMKEQSKLMSDQAKAANISGLIQGLSDIGYENFGMNQVNWRTLKGVDGPGTETYLDDITGRTRRQERRQARQARKAGKQN